MHNSGQHNAVLEGGPATCLGGLCWRALRPVSSSSLLLRCLGSAASSRPVSMSSLLLRCRGSAASSRLEALAGGSGRGASSREAGLAASLAPLLFLGGGGGFAASSSLEELSSLLLPESLPLSEEESLLSESLDEESLSEEESESPAWRCRSSEASCGAQAHACL